MFAKWHKLKTTRIQDAASGRWPAGNDHSDFLTVKTLADQARRWAGRIRPVKAAYLGMVALFLWTFGQFYIPGTGFSYLIGFGSRQETQRLSKLRQMDYYVAPQSDGYDAQYYVQIALDPSLTNRQLKKAVDNLPYRGRRILMSATAYALGLGQPVWILQAYALLNAFCWLALAAVLLRWFPPSNWNNFLRWAGILFSCGLCLSVRNALIDGPSLLLIALGVWLLERGRPWLATAVMGLSGLGKETNMFGAVALVPDRSDGMRAWLLAGLRVLLIAAPLALWMVYLTVTVGPANGLGLHNFDLPFIAYVNKWCEVVAAWPTMSADNFGPLYSVLILVALTVQFLYLLLCPQWEKAWWRIGATFALLMVFLGDAVWEGFPGAGSRVLLPMQLAFNVLVPVGRGWRLLLLAGNLTLLVAPAMLEPPPGPRGTGFELNGSPLLLTTSTGKAVIVKFAPEWYGTESGSNSNYWTWAAGDSTITITNPHASPLQARLRFGLSAIGPRTVRVVLNGVEIWRTAIDLGDTLTASFPGLPLRPGENKLEFLSDEPGRKIGADPRVLAFSVQNLRIDLQRRAPPAEPAR